MSQLSPSNMKSVVGIINPSYEVDYNFGLIAAHWGITGLFSCLPVAAGGIVDPSNAAANVQSNFTSVANWLAVNVDPVWYTLLLNVSHSAMPENHVQYNFEVLNQRW